MRSSLEIARVKAVDPDLKPVTYSLVLLQNAPAGSQAIDPAGNVAINPIDGSIRLAKDAAQLGADGSGERSLAIGVVASDGVLSTPPRTLILRVIPVVVALEVDNVGTESGDELSITAVRFTDAASRSSALTVYVRIDWGGSANPADVDMSAFPPSSSPTSVVHAITIAAGDMRSEKKIMKPVADGIAEGAESFNVTLIEDPETPWAYSLPPDRGSLDKGYDRTPANGAPSGNVVSATFTIYSGTTLVVKGANDDRARAQGHNPGYDPTDIVQGVSNTCFCLSPAALLAGYAWERLATANGHERFRKIESQPNTYLVTLYNTTTNAWQDLTVSADHVWGPFGAGGGDVNAAGEVEIWPVLLEKAYYQMTTSVIDSPLNEVGSDPWRMLRALLGPSLPKEPQHDETPTIGEITAALAAGKLVLISTNDLRNAPAPPSPQYSPDHVYIADKVDPMDANAILAFNPRVDPLRPNSLDDRSVKFTPITVPLVVDFLTIID